jgi:hypothetical protein
MDLSINNLNDVYDQSLNRETLNDNRKKEYEKMMDMRKNELIQVILRQTEYTELDAESKLKEHDFDVMKVLNDYHEISIPKKDYPKTTNQQIYGEIRNLMDIGAKSYRIKQEQAEMQDKNPKKED